MLMTACSSDYDILSPYDVDPNILRIQPEVYGIVESRTSPLDVASTGFSVDDAIMVSCSEDDYLNYFYKYVYNGNTWTPTLSEHNPSNQPYLTLDSEITKFPLKAFYPATGNIDSFKLPLTQDTKQRICNADFMTFKGVATRTKNEDGDFPPVSFTMQRWTARVCVIIDSFEDQFEDGSIENCDVTISTPYLTMYVDYETNTAFKSVNEISKTSQRIQPYNGKGLTIGKTATALVAPTSERLDDYEFIGIECTYKEGESSKTEYLYVKGIPVLKSGYSYTYHLKVGKKKLIVNSVSVEPWSEPITIQGGVAESNP